MLGQVYSGAEGSPDELLNLYDALLRANFGYYTGSSASTMMAISGGAPSLPEGISAEALDEVGLAVCDTMAQISL